MATNLEGVFGKEYEAVFDWNVSKTISEMFQSFGLQTKASPILDRFGNRYLGEMPGVVFKDAKDSASVWNQPLPHDIVPESIKYAMQKDEAIPKIMSFVAPGYDFKPDVITPASLVWLTSIHYLGIVTRLANYKKNDFMEQMQVICDDDLYPNIRKKLQKTHPEFIPYTPETGYKLIMTGEQKNVVKTIQSSLNKAKEPKYRPVEGASTNERFGVFSINDIQRTSIGPEDPKDMDLRDWRKMRSQVGAYLLSGALGMNCDRVMDLLSEGHVFAGCNFTGTSEYPLQPGVKIILRNELQLNLFSTDYGRHIIKESKNIRKQERFLHNKGIHDQGYNAARIASLEMGLENTSARLSEDLYSLSYGFDTSYHILKNYLTQKPDEKPRKSYQKQTDQIINMSLTNFVDKLIGLKETRDAFRKMIRPN